MGESLLKFELTLALADRPGQLLRALEPIAKNGGNIISIIHERDKPSEGHVPVSLVVDFPSHESFGKTLKDLKGLGIAIIKSEEVVEKSRFTLILIGKVIDLRMAERIEGLRIINLEILTPKPNEACIKLDVEIPADKVDEIMENFRKISEEYDALLISPI